MTAPSPCWMFRSMPTNSGELRFSSAGITDAVLAIAGSTEGTNQLAPYTVELRRP